MKKSKIEISVGVFVLIGLIGLAYLTIKLGRMEWFGDHYYTVNARFTSVSGLTSGAQVEIAGVRVGKVAAITLDPVIKVAVVDMKIENDVSISEDVIASIKTSGLIGDKYISLTPGGSEEIIPSGGTIIETESAVDIESLVSKYVFGGVE
jgi:phospholipid/cholesterol/gamma-HCH transport system substrate-binding protein